MVHLFSVLALLGLSTALYSAVRYTTLSYRVWADERGYSPSGTTDRFVLLQSLEKLRSVVGGLTYLLLVLL